MSESIKEKNMASSPHKYLVPYHLDTQALSSTDKISRDQRHIYETMIAEYIENHEIYEQQDVYSLLSVNHDHSPSRAPSCLQADNNMFCVTFKEYEANIGYPAFQFDDKKGKVKPIIKEVLDKLNGKYSDWDLLFWFNTYDDDLECKPLVAIDIPELRDLLLDIADNEHERYI